MRVVGTLVVAGMLALTSAALVPGVADARRDRGSPVPGQADGRSAPAPPAKSYGHERSSYGQGRSDEHDGSDERDRSNRRGESDDHDSSNGRDESPEADRSDGHDESNERDRPEDHDRSNERDRSDERDRSGERDRRDGRNGSDERDESGPRDRSSRRGQTGTEATQAPDVTPAQSAPAALPSVPAPSPAPPAAAPQADAPIPAGAGEDARRPAERGLGTGRRGGKTPRRLGSEPARRGSRDDGSSGGSATSAPEAFAAPAGAGARGGGDSPRAAQRRVGPSDDPGSPVVRTVRDIVEIVPGWMKLAIAGLAALSLLLAGGYAVSAVRARSLARQRSELLGEVGLLQAALLPAVPSDLGALKASVAYKPADGPAAGGDFYDVLPLPGGRCGFVLGDLSGHGRDALERTAFMRYTLRAYLEAGLEPRVALQVAGRVIGDGLGGDFATVLLAVHDPRDGSLTLAGAGHPAPIVVGGTRFEPVVAGSSPPLGIGERTGQRQTTVPLIPRSVACLFTDGLIEARTADGHLLGRERLEQIVGELGDDASASDLLERVSAEAVLTPDDMAACLLTPRAGVTSGGFRSEQLELSADELDGPLLTRFLDECGVPEQERRDATHDAQETAARFGGAVVSVVFGSRRRVQVAPRNVESLEAASLRRPAVASPRAS